MSRKELANDHVWNLYEATKILGLSDQEKDLVLFLFVLKIRGYLTDSRIVLDGSWGKILNASKNIPADESLLINQIIKYFDEINSVNSLPRLEIIVNNIRSINLDNQKDVAILYEYLLSLYVASQGRQGGQYTIPKSISEVMVNIAKKDKHDIIYNPFAGLASFAIGFENSVSVYGEEINEKIWILGSLRIIAHNLADTKLFELGDSITEWRNHNQKYDVIISAPPMGQRIFQTERGWNYNLTDEFGTISTAEQFLLRKGIYSLKESGKLIALLSQGVLFNKTTSEYNFRKFIVDEDLVECVISLPNVLQNTGVFPVILVINKAKKNKGVIQFVNFKDQYIHNKKEKQFEPEELNYLIDSGVEGEHLRLVPISEVIDQDYGLNVERYFNDITTDNTGVELTQLGGITTIVPGNRQHKEKEGFFIKIKELSFQAINNRLDLTNLTKSELSGNYRQITESCILVALRGGKLKPTYFEYDSTPIYINQDVAALKLDESAYFWQYICYQLHNENVLKQLKSFSTGSVIPTIRKEDLLKLKLFVPTLEEQKSIMQGTLNAYFKLKETELELAKQMQGYKEDATRQFQSIRHTFRQYLSALKSNVIGTRKFILNNDGNPISLNMIYSRNLNQTFGEHLDSINNLIDDFNKLLSNDVELSSDTSEMNLLTLIKEAQGKFKNESQFIFEEIEFDASSYTDIDGNNILPIVRINVNDFNILFSNVIANAIKHGFKNSNKKNIIRMFVGLEEEMCVIEISNNGKPIPKDFTLKHLTTRGEKTTDSDGIGSGGADMKSIIDKHNGTMDIVNDESNEYPVNYIFKLPLIKPTI